MEIVKGGLDLERDQSSLVRTIEELPNKKIGCYNKDESTLWELNRTWAMKMVAKGF